MTEKDLYPYIQQWLTVYIKERYTGYDVDVTYETSRKDLDAVLRNKNIVINEARGLSIKVDVVGILKKKDDVKFIFVEVKEKPLTLKDLGQLWGYTQLINPEESFLISPNGLGSLARVFKVLKREDLLRYGKKREKMMKVAKWDKKRNTIDYDSLIPKL